MPFFMTDDGVRLHYLREGRGPAVILIHGLTASSIFFQKQIPFLADHFDVIVPDLRGHGQSGASDDHLTLERLALDLAGLIDSLDLHTVSQVGWSMGAHVIFEYIRRFGLSRMNKIAIIDMAPKLMRADDWSWGLPGIFSGKPGDFSHEDNLYLLSVMLNDWSAYSTLVARRILNRGLTDEAIAGAADFRGKADLPWMEREIRKNKAWVIAAFWIAMAMQDYRPLLADIHIPCLLTYGVESNYYPPENYAFMKSRMPQATVVPIADCGHALHIQDPERFNRLLHQFLNDRSQSNSV